jgi:hypothetical protein
MMQLRNTALLFFIANLFLHIFFHEFCEFIDPANPSVFTLNHVRLNQDRNHFRVDIHKHFTLFYVNRSQDRTISEWIFLNILHSSM